MASGSFPVGDGAGSQTRVVLIDVRSERRALMHWVLDLAAGEGTVVAEVTDASEALRAIADCAADVAVVEIPLLVDEGLAIIASLRLMHPTLVIVVCTFHRDAATQRQAAEAGADEYLVKPVSARQLRAALNRRSLKPSANMLA
jgi:DNA-binding response OmpR family regulator